MPETSFASAHDEAQTVERFCASSDTYAFRLKHTGPRLAMHSSDAPSLEFSHYYSSSSLIL